LFSYEYEYEYEYGTLVERRSVTGELSLFYARLAADGSPLMWVNRPLSQSWPIIVGRLKKIIGGRSSEAHCGGQREKARVLTLYNDMIRKRHGFLQLARHRIKKRVQQDTFWVCFAPECSCLWRNTRFQYTGTKV